MTVWEHVDGLRKAAVDDLARAILLGPDHDEVLTAAECVVDSLAAYIIARLEHDDATRHEPPAFGL